MIFYFTIFFVQVLKVEYIQAEPQNSYQSRILLKLIFFYLLENKTTTNLISPYKVTVCITFFKSLYHLSKTV